MLNKKIIADIKDLTSSLIKNSTNEDLIKKNIDQIHIHFQNITEITGFDFKVEYLAAIPAAKGKALGLNHAAQCLLDYKRTVKFLTAIILAIEEKQKKHPGQLINIFYAGCGPYAPFITLIAPFFKPENVQFYLLEINKIALESAKKLIKTLGLSSYVQEFYLNDAVTFKVPDSSKFDILISETLDALLYRECYVPILFNLLPQFNKNTVLIPKNVLINLNLVIHTENELNSFEKNIGNVLNVQEEMESKQINAEIPLQLPDKKFDLKIFGTTTVKKVILDTQVHIYKDIFLNRNESSLTIPVEIELEDNPKKDFIVFTYFLQPDIELRYRFLE